VFDKNAMSDCDDRPDLDAAIPELAVIENDPPSTQGRGLKALGEEVSGCFRPGDCLSVS
jgi:hypothetical protein